MFFLLLFHLVCKNTILINQVIHYLLSLHCMKRLLVFFSVLTMMAGCHPAETCLDTPPQSLLATIDSLIQSQPDSALSVLLDEPMDNPYYQLLLSEALYKNDYVQANRPELLNAMVYFDSIGDAFMSARCHYMNGAGYYEMDSVVPACSEYLKALEIMEEHFEEKDLVGFKAKFMALTYMRLCELFSDQYLHEQAIYLGRDALYYYYKYDADPKHIAWVMNEIAINYTMTERFDSALYYCDKTIELLPDTNSQTYRDIVALQAILSYNKGETTPQRTLELFHDLLSKAREKKELLARCLNIGDVFYHEKAYDSAWYYLIKVFLEGDLVNEKKQAAEWLVGICKFQGKSTELYADFLIPFANKEENISEIKSQLSIFYNLFCQKKLENQHQRMIKKNIKRIIALFVGLLFVLLVISILYHKRKKIVGVLTEQIAKEQSLTTKRKLFEQFLNETICQDIIHSINGKVIKRTTIPPDYQELILSDVQLQQLALVTNRYFGPFENRLEQCGIRQNPCLVNLCHLYLLGMNEKQAAILLNRDYSSIKRYEKKLKNGFKTQKDLVLFFKNLVLNN